MMGFRCIGQLAVFAVLGTVLPGAWRSVSAQAPAVPPETVVMEKSTPISKKPDVSLSESISPSASLPTSSSMSLASPTPAYPISSLFVDAVASPSATLTPTPPPEAFATPALEPDPAEPTPARADSKTNTAQTGTEVSSIPTLISTEETTETSKEIQSTPMPSLLGATPSPMAITPSESAIALPALVPTSTPVARGISKSGKLDLNAATEQELMGLPGIDAYRARLIILHRQAILGFARTDQLMDVYGISEQIFRQVAPLIRVGDRANYSRGTLQTEIPPVQPLQTPIPPELPESPQLRVP